ncbi:MAG: hypothetical protein KC421_19965, partial [Anaerolineales bacterium]|nr:hypothetical protein [Anaerolineales bacterium]
PVPAGLLTVPFFRFGLQTVSLFITRHSFAGGLEAPRLRGGSPYGASRVARRACISSLGSFTVGRELTIVNKRSVLTPKTVL